MSNSSTLPVGSLSPLPIESDVLHLLRDSMAYLWRLSFTRTFREVIVKT